MKSKILAAILLVLIAACSEPPKPAAKAPAPPVIAPPPPPSVEAKAPEAPKADPNKELARRVKRALEDEAKIQAAGIDVTAADGVVTLWGTAASDAERRRAAQAAAKVEGVKAVDNKLVIIRGS